METNFNTQSGVALTPESIFLSLYMDALRNLQTTWLDRDVNKEAFVIQIEFIRNLIPDKKVRGEISLEMDRVRNQVLRERNGQEKNADMHAGLAVVPHLISFIITTYDLLTEDVVGPGMKAFFNEAPNDMPEYEENDTKEAPANGN